MQSGIIKPVTNGRPRKGFQIKGFLSKATVGGTDSLDYSRADPRN